MKLAIMQPYFLSYIGYYQLIAAVDTFIIYDNIKYTKKGWINRNRILQNGTDAAFTLPLKKDSDTLNVVERELASNFDRIKLLNQFKGAYSRAPFFLQTIALLERILRCEDNNLFGFIYRSVIEICSYLEIDTEIQISSQFAIDHALKGQDKVIALCQAKGADTYINTIGGINLYSPKAFKVRGIELKFIKPTPLEYQQFGAPLVPWLSIIDILMFNQLDTVRANITSNHELI